MLSIWLRIESRDTVFVVRKYCDARSDPKGSGRGQGVALRGHDRKSQADERGGDRQPVRRLVSGPGLQRLLEPQRRGFITNAARKIGTVGGSLRDVQLLAGHASTTQRYIEAYADAQRRIVELV